MNKSELLSRIQAIKTRSQWDKGIKYYMEWIVEDYPDSINFTNAFQHLPYKPTEQDKKHFKHDRTSLNYYCCFKCSKGGSFEVCNQTIIETLLTAATIKKAPKKHHENAYEYQTKAIYQACLFINDILNGRK